MPTGRNQTIPPLLSGEDVTELVGGGVGAAVGEGVDVVPDARTDTLAVPLPHAGSGWFGWTASGPGGVPL